MDEETILRFCNKIKKDSNTQCWNWIGAKSGNYGIFRVYGGLRLAHRVSMHLFNNTQLESYSRTDGLVLHKCNNSLCVNPRHLYIGTQAQNIKDCVDSGNRFIKKSKYTRSDFNAMEILISMGYTKAAIARLYGCSKTNIGYLLNGSIKLADE